ncbi:MAG: tetratricopeptide repeat protein, partial [bacterium]
PSTTRLAAGGFSLGLSAITRPTVLLFALLLGLYLLYRYLKKQQTSLSQVALFSLAVIIPILPVTIHNYTVSGEFTLIGTYSGMNLFIGNNSEADGVSAELPGARHSWWGMMEDSKQMAEADVGHELTAAEQSGYWTKRAAAEIVSDPVHWLAQLGRKAALLLWGEELSNNVELYFFAHQTAMLKPLLWKFVVRFPWGVILPLALLGMVLVWSRRPEMTVLLLYLIGLSLPLLLFFVTARYRVPLVPVLLLFAAAGLTMGIREWPQLGVRRKTVGVALTVLACIVANVNLLGYRTDLGAHGYHTMATLYDEAGDLASAEEYYRKALAVDPELPESLNDLAMLLAYQGRYDEAIQLLERGVANDPGSRVTRFNLASFYVEVGRLDEAVTLFSRFLEEWPSEIEAWNKLGNIYFRRGDYGSALNCFERTTALDSSYVDGYYNAAIAQYQLGHIEAAAAAFNQVLEHDPLRAGCNYYLGLIMMQRGDRQAAIGYFEDFLSLWQGEQLIADEAARLIDSLKAL